MVWGPFYVKLSSFLGIYISTLSCIVTLPDEMCVSHTKRIGDKKTVFNTEEVRMRASHWFIFLKNNQNRQQEKALMQILQQNR